MHFLDYKKSLGIAIDDKSKVELFFTKIFNVLNIMKNSGNTIITNDEYFSFCNTAGVLMRSNCLNNVVFDDIVSVFHSHTDSIEEFLPYYMIFVNCLENIDYRKCNRQFFVDLICKLFEESQISYEIREDEDGYFIFPHGAKELDDALVSENLEWLKEYPKSRIAFIKALKDYADQNEQNASDIADKFRKVLENFFQEFFGSEKSLENYKSEYGAYLKKHGVPAEISNNFESILQAYTNYINNYAKHHDRTSLNVLEYIMYQTGNIIRLLITLKKT